MLFLQTAFLSFFSPNPHVSIRHYWFGFYYEVKGFFVVEIVLNRVRF